MTWITPLITGSVFQVGVNRVLFWAYDVAHGCNHARLILLSQYFYIPPLMSYMLEQTAREMELSSHSAEDSFDLANEGLEGAFRRFSPYVAAIGLRLLGRDADVDDLVQNVFLKAHRHLHSLKDPDAIKAWLARIAVNTAKRMLYKRRVKRWLGLDDIDYEELIDPQLDPEKRLLLVQLLRKLDDVSVQARLAWTLRRIQGEKLKEVADLCECSLATVKRRIAEVDDLLQAELHDE